jgi:hypothetical protein
MISPVSVARPRSGAVVSVKAVVSVSGQLPVRIEFAISLARSVLATESDPRNEDKRERSLPRRSVMVFGANLLRVTSCN